ncbi:type III secretion system inner membrane ring lipoprotein SctJ [Lonsdalea quercina]|uniref:type III secretion system inner membrane ring lipoprotein SctJ n=1 Tax=Lonsdalea quercina TaxID=71657 RepID=UPI0039763BB5
MRHCALKRGLLLLLVWILTGCGDRVELYRNLSENDANEVIAELGSYHIDAEKSIDKTGITLLIDAYDIERAVNILNAAGLPRQNRTNLGEVFQKTGVISTPLEERARYIYALSQEVESTLSQIDGIVVARVHVVLPERIAPGEPIQPASAAVFIKHRADLDPDSIRPRIRRMVASSIPGLSGKSDKDLSIVFSLAKPYQDRVQTVSLGPLTLTPQGLNHLLWAGFFLALVIAGGVGGFMAKPWWRQQQARKNPPTQES